MTSPIRGRELAVCAGGLVAVAAVTRLLLWLPDVSPTTVALALLLVVLGTATLGGLRTAAVLSVVAMLTFNFFFLPPVGTFTIADPQNWVALVAFLVVAMSVSHLSTVAHARAREAVERRNEVTRLFDLTRDVLLSTDTVGAIEGVARYAARRFELPKVAVCLPRDHGWHVVQGTVEAVAVTPATLDDTFARARRTLEYDARERAYGGHATAGDDQEIRIVPLRHGTKAVGLLAVESPAVDIGTLDAIAGVVAIAIERAQFLADRDAADLTRQRGDLASTLLASLSHDLRTPLTAIRVAVENLRGDLPAEERQRQGTAAAAEVDRLVQLVQDILDMARIDSGALAVTREWVTAADVVDAAVAQVQHALEGHRLVIDADATRAVEIDPKLTSAALSHLLENAARYSPAGQPIEVRGHATEDALSLTVTDRGPGLDPAELDHLFERFYRGHSARSTTIGTGMGLSITRGLLAAAGGRVWGENIVSPTGQVTGACFSIRVPGHTRQG